ncbi:MAG: hypothetical protein JSU65_06390 [Candidatus Zixiibacteriota bacterium]|nr:MAG: hypothetical protein JSU65_06390 [candidate division Zixibacteria bacterium]
MTRSFTVASLIVCMVMTFGACRDSSTPAIDLQLTVDSLEHKLAWLNRRLSEESWTLLTEGQSDSLAFYQTLLDQVLGCRETFEHLKAGLGTGDDPELERKLSLLLPRLLMAQVEQDLQVRLTRDSIVAFLMSPLTEFDGQPRDRSFIARRMFYDNDRTRRELAYRALSAAGDHTAQPMARLFRVRNQLAGKLGYNNFFAMTLNESGFPVEAFRSLVDTLNKLTAGPYAEVTDRIRQKYATAEIEIWDLPHEYSSSDVALDRLFPADSQMRFLERAFSGIGFQLDALPVYFFQRAAEMTDAGSAALVINAPIDQRVVVAAADGFQSTVNLAEQIGAAVAAAFVYEQTTMYTSMRDQVWLRGLEQIFSRMMKSDHFLSVYAGVPAALVDLYLTNAKQRRIIELRLTLLRLQFEYQAYSNPDRDLNRLYWDLFEEYMLLPRHDELMPWATTPEYAVEPAQSHTFLLGDVISAQTFAYLERVSGSILDNPETKAFLVQNYFRFGSRFYWQDLLERGTGEPLNAQYFIKGM